MTKIELNSWKEIADHLGVTVRTAQRWEKEQGLPVRRLPGERGRVLSLVADLEAWKRSQTGEPGAGPSDPAAPGLPSGTFRVRRLAVPFAVVLLVIALAAGYLLLPGQPSRWRLEGATLIVLDARNRETWRWEAHQPFSSQLTPEVNRQKPFIWIGDLDGDGRNETLLVPKTANLQPERESIPLICFDSRGNERWRFRPGRKLSSGREEFPDLFRIDNFRVAPMAKGRPNSILVTALQIPDYPCQIALLDIESGEPVREYWHSGHIGNTLELADLDQDGVLEIYLAGANSARFRRTLVVLDPDNFEGASYEEHPDYQLQGFPPGREIRRVILPRTCLDLGRDIGAVFALSLLPDGAMVSITGEVGVGPPATLDYYFSPQGKLRKMSPSNNYLAAHEAAYLGGRLDHPFSHDEHRAIEQAVIVLPPSSDLSGLKPAPESP